MDIVDKHKDFQRNFSSLQITSFEEYNEKEDTEVREEDEDEDVEVDEDEDIPMTLGFVEKPKNLQLLQRQFFPSKAGGVPAWLDPVNLPFGRHSVCDICNVPLQFVLQIYAPISEKDSTFHRSLFLFMCTSMPCLLQDQHEQWKRPSEKPSRSVKVFRCQLPRSNSFYSIHPPKFDRTDKPLNNGVALCSWCGTWKGEKICSCCRVSRYCSEKHQLSDWRNGHKSFCRQARISPQSYEKNKVASNTLWLEYEIIIEDENEYLNEPEDEKQNTLLVPGVQEEESLMMSVLDKMEGYEEKRSWASFQERIAKAPEQVLRYSREEKAKPLWPMLAGRPSNADIPRCKYCNEQLRFEFQVVPQLLYYFGVQNEADSLDWATIAVYTCPSSCDSSVAYEEEFAWVQLSSPSSLT